MDDIGNILYIVLMVIFLVAGAFRNKGKGKNVEAPKRPSQRTAPIPLDPFEEIKRYFDSELNPPVVVEEIEEELEEEFEDSPQIVLEKSLSEPTPDAPLTPYSIEKDASYIDISVSELEGKDAIRIGELEMKRNVYKEGEKTGDGLSGSIDLRDAIIYDAILNRPDI